LGVGYLRTRYRYYEARRDENNEWHLFKQYPGNYTWMGPVKAKISLVWHPLLKKRDKNGK
jgi:hypothetical protein